MSHVLDPTDVAGIGPVAGSTVEGLHGGVGIGSTPALLTGWAQSETTKLTQDELNVIAGQTLRYYDDCAQQFREATVGHDMSQNILALHIGYLRQRSARVQLPTSPKQKDSFQIESASSRKH